MQFFCLFYFIWFDFIWLLCTILSCLLSASVSLILQWFICWKENNMALVTCIMTHNVICLTTKSTSCADIQMNVWKIKINLSDSLNHIFCLHFPFHLAEHWSITACSNEQQVVKSCMCIYTDHIHTDKCDHLPPIIFHQLNCSLINHTFYYPWSTYIHMQHARDSQMPAAPPACFLAPTYPQTQQEAPTGPNTVHFPSHTLTLLLSSLYLFCPLLNPISAWT